MLIKDLIKKLQELPPKKEIYLEDNEYGLSDPYIYQMKSKYKKDNYYRMAYDYFTAKDY